MRYFFRIENSVSQQDDEGVELPDFDAAKRMALVLLAEVLRDDVAYIFSGHTTRLLVLDESGAMVIALTASGVAVPVRTPVATL